MQRTGSIECQELTDDDVDDVTRPERANVKTSLPRRRFLILLFQRQKRLQLNGDSARSVPLTIPLKLNERDRVVFWAHSHCHFPDSSTPQEKNVPTD